MAERATYEVSIDLDGDGAFGAGDVVTADVDNPDGSELARTERGGDAPTILSNMIAGQLDVVLDNRGGDYSPGGDLVPGRGIRLRATYDGVTRDLWTGRTGKPVQRPGTVAPTTQVSAQGVFALLVGKTVSTTLYENVTTGVAIGHLLDAAGYTGARDLDAGKTTLRWYWETDADAFEALQVLRATEGPGAQVYEAGDGTIVFKHRTARAEETASNTSQATVSGAGAEPLLSHPFEYEPGEREVFNVAEIAVHRRAAAALAVVWTLGEALALSPGEARTFTAQAANDAATGQPAPLTAAVTPAGGTDYTIVSGSLASVTLNRTSGGTIEITLTAGASGAVLTGLQLRAQAVTVAGVTRVPSQIDASASIAEYGRKPWDSSMRREIDVQTAQDTADAIVGWHKDGRPSVEFGLLANASVERMELALDAEIGHRLTVVEADSGVSADFYVESVQHEISAPATHRTVIGASRALAANYGIWDDATWGGGDLWAW